MTPDNDLTLRGIFRPDKPGYDEWNDARDYRKRFGQVDALRANSPFSTRINDLMMHQFMDGPRVPTIIEPEKRGDEDNQYRHLYWMYEMFPQSKSLLSQIETLTYGFGLYDHCDCCGRILHSLNSTAHYMCVDCETSHDNRRDEQVFL